ncbi:beta-lactamase superfamily protein [Sarocladium implicatum]|nr:beta-lactamase superfamily protein [Sarocladium implicatum]
MPQSLPQAAARVPLLRNQSSPGPERPLPVKNTRNDPSRKSDSRSDASVYFVGNATVIIEWKGFRILTDPNFIHQGDEVHLGPGVTATRETNPAVDLDELPPIDLVVLSHYHEDHFDKFVEQALNRDVPIVSTEHAKSNLGRVPDENGGPFKKVTSLDPFEETRVQLQPTSGEGQDGKRARPCVVKVTAMPGSHVPPGPVALANSILHAIPPSNGWLIEFGHPRDDDTMTCSYSIYISGDTLFVDELNQIPGKIDRQIDLMLVHLGGTTVPSPALPVAMVTMDGKQGVQLMELVKPRVTVPIHYDDYSVFASPLEDFKKAVREQDREEEVVYLDRGDMFLLDVEQK